MQVYICLMLFVCQEENKREDENKSFHSLYFMLVTLYMDQSCWYVVKHGSTRLDVFVMVRYVEHESS